MKEVEYIIGIDWGKKRCGIAIADNETLIASGYCESDHDSLILMIRKIANQMNITKIIIGISSISENEQQNKQIKSIANKLTKAGFSVETEEEAFSTAMAQKHLLDAHKKHISKNDNIESARIILQGWIDKNM